MQPFARGWIPMEKVAPGLSSHPHDVHWDENRVYSNEGEEEVNLAQTFVHHLAKHLGEPEISPGEHPEDCRHTHDQVEVANYEGGVVQRNVYRGLAQEQAGDAARDEQRNEPDREQHRRSEA